MSPAPMSVVSTYNATGDTRTVRQPGRVRCLSFEPSSVVRHSRPGLRWYQQYANLWGCYTNLCQWVGHYGDDDVALGNFNNNVAALAL